jgi:hypothetical protein
MLQEKNQMYTILLTVENKITVFQSYLNFSCLKYEEYTTLYHTFFDL